MSRPYIVGFVFDEENEQKIDEHHLASLQVLELLDSPYLVVKNRKRRRGPYLIIGRDHGGTCIVAPV